MIFQRSPPVRRYRRYSSYPQLLRHDFQYRCAYCLTHEFHLGGEAAFAIDHHRPRKGLYARPDLENDYRNLYWCCAECNQNKADHWASPQEEALGFGWIDPCEVWGDHDMHWNISPEGEICWLTPRGEYTIKTLLLNRREWLKYHWNRLHTWQQRREVLINLLMQKTMTSEIRSEIEYQLQELNSSLEPPVFHRSRGIKG